MKLIYGMFMTILGYSLLCVFTIDDLIRCGWPENQAMTMGVALMIISGMGQKFIHEETK